MIRGSSQSCHQSVSGASPYYAMQRKLIPEPIPTSKLITSAIGNGVQNKYDREAIVRASVEETNAKHLQRTVVWIGRSARTGKGGAARLVLGRDGKRNSDCIRDGSLPQSHRIEDFQDLGRP